MVINVGNLRVGGTGKTPMVEYLIRLLHKDYGIATLSRGYKRKTTGFLLAGRNATAADLGDEPYQLFLKFGDVAQVAVGEERALAIPGILLESPGTQVIIMDDAYQHRTVLPDLNILLTEYAKPFYEDYLLPSGRLREARKGADRANIVIVTKSPANLSTAEMELMKINIHRYSGDQTPVFFTYLVYGGMRMMDNSTPIENQKYLLFSGLANPESFNSKMSASFNIVETVSYPDHHNYDERDLNRLIDKATAADASLLTTEKDMVKLKSAKFAPILQNIGLCYIPIAHKFVENGNVFDSTVLNAIANKKVVEKC